jgi:hypothetical protein
VAVQKELPVSAGVSESCQRHVLGWHMQQPEMVGLVSAAGACIGCLTLVPEPGTATRTSIVSSSVEADEGADSCVATVDERQQAQGLAGYPSAVAELGLPAPG